MSTVNIFLVVISGLGVVHGLFLAVFLWLYQEGNSKSNKILSLLLVVLSFRIGKSVLLEFSEATDIKLIFVGLATMMAIGPLYYFFVLSYVDKAFQFKKKHLLHFIPTLIGIAFGFWMNDGLTETLPVVFFAMVFLSYYGHYLTYLIIGFKAIPSEQKEAFPNAYALMRLLFYALLAIWLVYVLNLFDEFVPYIFGPILYTLVAYVVSFVVIKKGYIKASRGVKYQTTPISDEQISHIFNKVSKLVIDDKQFKNPDLSLKLLSEKLNVSTQVLSLVINKKAEMNFNAFINQYRIDESIQLFQNVEFGHLTIAAIAFEVGFNSISSFNTAFKKQTQKTPLSFRNQVSK